MSERDEYPAGVPCWVDTLQPDAGAALRFYGDVLGWEFEGPGPGEYHVARVRGADVAGVGAGDATPGWNTYVRVESADEAAAAARAAGGTVVAEPFDVLPAGRVAVVAAPEGARIGLWE